MLKQHARLIDLAFRLADLLLITLALPVAYKLYLFSPLARAVPPPIEQMWLPMVALLIGWIAVSGFVGVYGNYRRQGVVAELGKVVKAQVLLAMLASTLIFAVKADGVPRLLVGLFFGSFLAFLVASRLFVRVTARAVRSRGYNTRFFAVVGTGEAAEAVAETFASHPEWGFRLAGFILPQERLTTAMSGPVLGSLDDLERILDTKVIDEIVFAVPREQLGSVERAVKLCEEQGVAVVVSLEPLQLGSGRMSLFELSDLNMLVFSRTPTNPIALATKRLFDILVSATALIMLAPLFVLVAIAIRLESPGPVFFRQMRVGRSGRPFAMMKFRSMYRDAEQRLEALRAMNEMSGPVFKMTNDPRITRVGKFIRRTSIDELPQFWNVLRGEMSVVGPRPPVPSEVRQYKRWQRRRLSVKPGITCTWQVSGRNNIDFDRWMELDLEYIDNWSLWKDMQIFLKTIPAVISARGAH